MTEVNVKHNICSLYLESIFGILSLSIANFKYYSQIEYKGTLYKRGYYLTKFIGELCLFEILELVVLNNISGKVYIIAQQVKIIAYHLQIEANEINSNLYVMCHISNRRL